MDCKHWDGTEGRNVRIEKTVGGRFCRRNEGPRRELVALEPNVIVVISTPVTAAVMQETHTIPIIFLAKFDPVGSASWEKPRGAGRQHHRLHQLRNQPWPANGSNSSKRSAPQAARVAIIYNPQTAPYAGALLRSIETAGPVFAIQPSQCRFETPGTIETAIEAFAREINPGLLVLPDVTTTVHEKLIVKLAVQHRLPAIYPWRHFVTFGGLMCTRVDLPDLWRRSASLCRSGASRREADRPAGAGADQVRARSQSQDAKAIGLDVPATLLARADEVIE